MELLAAYGPMAALIFAGIFGVVFTVVKAMAARPEVDGWDTALAVIEKIAPIVDQVEDWADPDSDSVPPSPSNPAGLA